MTHDNAVVDINHYEDGRVADTYSSVPGQWISFGDCRVGCCQPVIVTLGASGHIIGYENDWVIANHSPHVTLIVRHAERPDDRITVQPGQGDTIISFDIAEILGAHGHVLTVLGAGPKAHTCHAPCAGDIPDAWGLDPTTTYYKVMITAVRPIIDGTNDPLPTPAEIAEQHVLSLSQVYDHLTHLCRLLDLTPHLMQLGLDVGSGDLAVGAAHIAHRASLLWPRLRALMAPAAMAPLTASTTT